MAPVLAKVCKYESLIDGTLDLHDIALMNDALRCQEDNNRIATKGVT